jgi:hypothetical protein
LVVALVATAGAAAQGNTPAADTTKRTGERSDLIVAERAEPALVADVASRDAGDRNGKRSSLLLLAVLVAVWCTGSTWRRSAPTAQPSAPGDASGTHHLGRAPPAPLLAAV